MTAQSYAVISPDKIQTSKHATLASAREAAERLAGDHWIGGVTQIVDATHPDGHPRRVVAAYRRTTDEVVEVNP